MFASFYHISITLLFIIIANNIVESLVIVWREQCPPAVNTSNSVADLVLRGEVDAVFHSGDISYANGYLSGWDFFLDMVSPIAGKW